MAHVAVTIDGRKYRLACNEGEEQRLEQLAATIDGKISELRGEFGEIGDQRLVVMAALTVADNLMEAREEAKAARKKSEIAEARAGKVAGAVEKLAARLEALAGRLAGEEEASG